MPAGKAGRLPRLGKSEHSRAGHAKTSPVSFPRSPVSTRRVIRSMISVDADGARVVNVSPDLQATVVVDTSILPSRSVISDGLSAAVPRVELLELEELFIHTIYEARAWNIHCQLGSTVHLQY